MDFTHIEEKLNSTLSEKRIRHCFSTARQTCELIERFPSEGIGSEDGYMVGLWHDIAREWTDDALFSYCLCHHIAMEREELANPMLLHGPVAATLMEQEIPQSRQIWQTAVRWHTLGSPVMGKLGAALYVADYLEPLRTHITDGQRQELLDMPSLEDMCLCIAGSLCKHLLDSRQGKPANSTLGLQRFLAEGGRF